MEIPGTTRRPIADAPALETKAHSITGAPSSPTDTDRLGTPTTTREWSASALLLSLLQVLEIMPPDDAAVVLSGLATKLDVVAPHLQVWAERFRAAAQTGDLSKLLPNIEPATHFGIRAYRAASQVPADDMQLVALLRDSMRVLAAAGGETREAALVLSEPSVSSEALALLLLRRSAVALRMQRRMVAGRARRRRRRQRRRAALPTRSPLRARHARR